MAVHSWTGETWETYVHQLCRIRHGSDYQRVPDKHKGDYGLEGFSVCAQACAYQCYCAESGISTKELYDRQRDKITEDIGKFKKNATTLTTMFSGTKVKRWILAVPEHESAQLNVHAGQKTTEVRDAKLDYVHQDFKVLIHAESDFGAEAARLVSEGRAALHLPVDDLDTDAIKDWADSNDHLVATMDRKLNDAKPKTQKDDLVKWRNELLRHHIRVQNTLGWLKDEFPEAWESAQAIIATREQMLLTISMTHEGSPVALLRQNLESLSTELKEVISALQTPDANVLASGITADWLLRCPLELRGVA